MSDLVVQGLIASYGPVRVLHGIDFQVAEGTTVVVLGANGAGKTTTLRALTGMTRNSGSITYDGKDITHASTDKIVRMGVAHVPQGRGTFADQTVNDNLRLGAYTRRDSEVRTDLQRVYELFPRLEERREQTAGNLSGGEQQMLAIARAIMLKPHLLLLDEPSLGLAPIIVKELFHTLVQLKEASGVTVLLVEQNANLALEIADHAYVLEAGEIVVGGPASQIQADEGVRRAYLGY